VGTRRSFVLLVLAALLPLLVLSAVLGLAALLQQRDAFEREAFARVNQITSSLQRELSAQVQLLQLLARTPSLGDTIDEIAFTEFASRARADNSLWSNVSLSTVDGTRLIDVPEPLGGIKRGKVLELASHQRVAATREPAIGRILIGPRNRPAFAIRVPVLRNGRLTHVLSAVVEPSAIRDLLYAAGLPYGWVGAVIDGEGNLIARTTGPSTLIGHPASEAAREAKRRAPQGIYKRDLGGHPAGHHFPRPSLLGVVGARGHPA